MSSVWRTAGALLLMCFVISRFALGQQTAESLSPTSTMRAGEVFRDCPDCPEMVVIPPGSFSMGSSDSDTSRDLAAVTGKFLEYSRRAAADAFATEHPQHPVVQDHSFALGKYLVTRGEFAVFARETGYVADAPCITFVKNDFSEPLNSGWQNPGFAQTDRDPVVCVTWKDTRAFIEWLNQKINKQRSAVHGSGLYRLPSEAEWEYAARAGQQTSWWWGDSVGQGNADCTICGSTWDNTGTAPIDAFRPNPFGLYEMIGNVFEWTEDCWNSSYSGAPNDGSSWKNGDCGNRVARGGSWLSDPFATRSAARTKFSLKQRTNYLGFRLEKSL
jgi:formylglycine-generating enzyme required for sulfatase activity